MNLNVPRRLHPGIRFVFRNTIFEILSSGPSGIRYVSCDGGRTYVFPTLNFWHAVDKNEIGFLAMNGSLSNESEDELKLWQVSEKQQSQMLLRFKYVKAAFGSREKPFSRANLTATITFVAEENGDASPPGVSTLARWMQLYIAANGDHRVLIPRHKTKGSSRKRFPLEIEAVISDALSRDFLTTQRPSLIQVYCNIVGRIRKDFPQYGKGLIPSARTIYRRKSEIDPYLSNRARFGLRYAEMNNRAAGSSIEVSRLMETVMIDGHRLDVIVVDPDTGESLGRPFLTCLFDVFSRAIVGWHISMLPFCATTALAAIKKMCAGDPSLGPGGIPESILPDNGRDLSSAALRNLCRTIGFHIQPAKAYCPDDKAHLERFFRTVNSQLTHLLPGTTFSSPNDRGDYDSLERSCLTLNQLTELFSVWLEKTYHLAVHSGTQRAPMFAWREFQLETPILHYREEEIDVVARVGYRRTINSGRVTVDGLSYKSDALSILEARGHKQVTVLVDELNLGHVFVRDEQESEVLIRAECTWKKYSTGLTKYEHDEIKLMKKERAEGDRRMAGEYYYEVSRWKLWELIQEMKPLGKRRLGVLTQGMGRSSSLVRDESNDQISEVKEPKYRDMENQLDGELRQEEARTAKRPPLDFLDLG